MKNSCILVLIALSFCSRANPRLFPVPSSGCTTVTAGSVSGSTNVACGVQSHTFTALGASFGADIIYQWKMAATASGPFVNVSGGSGANTISYVTPTLGTGTYFFQLVVTCTASSASATSAAVSLSVGAQPTISVSDGHVCAGKSFTLSPSGAASYTFQPAGPVVTPNATTSYSITGKSALGCMSTNTAVATVTYVPAFSVSIQNGTLCIGQSYTFNPSGASTYSFGGGSAVVSPTNITTYTVAGYSAEGCRSSNTPSVKLTPYNTPVITMTVPSAVCSGKNATLTAGGANTYTWSTGATGTKIVIIADSTQLITVTGTDIVGCGNAASKNLNVNPSPTLSITQPSTLCPGDTVHLSASGATSYTWSNGVKNASLTLIPKFSQTYSVTGSIGSCTSGSAVQVNVENGPSIEATATRTVLCSGEQITLNATGADSYTWSGGAVSGTPFTPSLSTYTVWGTAPNGCTGSTTVTLVIHSLPGLVATSNHNPLCLGQVAKLLVTGPASYQWSTGHTSATVAVSPTISTLYSVTGTSPQNCVSTVTFELKVTDCTGLDENAGDHISIFPSPVTRELTVSVENSDGFSIRMFGVSGKVVLLTRIEGPRATLDLGSLEAGIYMIEIRNGDRVSRSRIIRQ